MNQSKKLNLTVGIIVLNGDFFLRQVIESLYPYAHAICIAEGAVNYWAQQGITTSTDDTLEILTTFPDPENKIKVVHGTYAEKDDQCRAWFNLVPDDTDYILCCDSDEVHTGKNIERLIDYLSTQQPTSVGFKSDSFYGGFERIIGGFERDHSFKRVLKYEKGCIYRTHRQPTLSLNGNDIQGKDITGNQLYAETGITMWHGSYVSPKGVYEKIKYYESAVIKPGACIPNYFTDVFMPWVTQPDKRDEIENRWRGVQEFMPQFRGDCFTLPFTGEHPDVILRDWEILQNKFNKQLEYYVKNVH